MVIKNLPNSVYIVELAKKVFNIAVTDIHLIAHLLLTLPDKEILGVYLF